MSLDLLFPNFDELIRTPEDVQRLNEAILQLAVQGKLVPQDPNDEPASELLTRIQAKKSRNFARTDGGPFPLPKRWAWTRLDSVLEMEYGKGLPAKERDDSGTVPVYGSNGIVGRHKNELVRQPSVIIGRKGSSGAVNLSLEPCWVIDTAYFVVPPNGLDLLFTYRLLQSLHLENLGKGIKPGLTRSEAYDLVLAVPPLAEQQRIVAKVDELFAQTRALETRLRQAQADVVTVNRAALHRLHTAQDDDQFQTAWRTIRDHFDLLYDDPRTVADLRQTILDLAVRGKLVAQDPRDEPAEELLRRIEAEKARLIRERKIAMGKPMPPINSGQTPFDLPDYWLWVRFGTVAVSVQYGYTASADYSVMDVKFLRITDIQNDRVEWNQVPGCSIDEREEPKYLLRQNDILIARTGGTVGKSYLIEDLPLRAVFASYLIRIVPPKDADARYIKLFLGSKLYWRQLVEQSKGTGQPNVNGVSLSQLVFPLPPLAEQQRIVTKIDQLMRLCDALEAGLVQAELLRRKVVAAVLQTQ